MTLRLHCMSSIWRCRSTVSFERGMQQMRFGKSVWSSAVIAALLVPASSFAVSFDCTKAQGFREKSVCSNAELGKLDDELSAAYQAAKGTWGDQQSLKDSQRKWMSEANRCADEACIAKAYSERIAELDGSDAEEGDTDNVEEGDNDGGAATGKATGAPAQAKPAENSASPLGGLIQQELEKTERQNREAAEATGDYSLSGPKASAPPPLDPKADGKTSVPVEIKGIRVGMSVEEVSTLVKEAAAPSGKKCEQGPVRSDDGNLVLGDYVIVCDEAFTYFGKAMRNAQFFFVDGRLKVGTLQDFYSSNANFDFLPEVVRALCDSKFKVQPQVGSVVNPHFDNMGGMTATWIDPNGDKLIFASKYDKNLSGVDHKNGVMQLAAHDLDASIAARKNALIQKAQEQQRQQDQQRKNDL